MGLFLSEIKRLIHTGCPKKCINRTKSKLSAVGLNFTMDMTWGRLILLSRIKKRPKNTFQAQVMPETGD